MERYKEIYGDLIELALNGEFDVITHGCNCHSVMRAGLAVTMKKTFGCDKFEMETWGSTIEKLGCIDYATFVLGKNTIWLLSNADNKGNEPELTVVNSYTQYNYGLNHIDGSSKPLDYEALTLCMRKINNIFKGKRIGLPAIGSGLGGGDLNIIRNIITKELSDCYVTLVLFNK